MNESAEWIEFDGIKFREIGFGQYQVQSSRYRPDQGEVGMGYIVDLTKNKPECSCTDYTARCIPRFRKHRKIIWEGKKDRNVCKHSKAIIKYLTSKSEPNY